jgi:hypothetical protein
VVVVQQCWTSECCALACDVPGVGAEAHRQLGGCSSRGDMAVRRRGQDKCLLLTPRLVVVGGVGSAQMRIHGRAVCRAVLVLAIIIRWGFRAVFAKVVGWMCVCRLPKFTTASYTAGLWGVLQPYRRLFAPVPLQRTSYHAVALCLGLEPVSLFVVTCTSLSGCC